MCLWQCSAGLLGHKSGTGFEVVGKEKNRGKESSVFVHNQLVVCCFPTSAGWFRGTVVERRSVIGERSLSYFPPAADG